MSSLSRPDELAATLPSAHGDGLRRPRPLSVYVAAAQEDFGRARAAMDLLRELGVGVTHDWTIEVESHCNTPATLDDLRYYAVLDLEAVKRADVVLALTPDTKDKGCGLWAELGMAAVLGKRVVVTGPLRDRCIFAHVAGVARHVTDAEGILEVLRG